MSIIQASLPKPKHGSINLQHYILRPTEEENQNQEAEVAARRRLGAVGERDYGTVAAVVAAAGASADSIGNRRHSSDSHRRPHMDQTRSTEHTGHCSLLQPGYQRH